MTDVYSFSEERYILIGKVAKPHGLRGELKFYSFSEEPETLLAYSRITLVDNKGSLSPALNIEKARVQGKFAVIKLDTINNRDDAEALHGQGILIEKDDLPLIEADEYYWHQFLNVAVYLENGEKIGVVENIFSNGAQDIMVIRDNNQEYLVPILNTILLEHNQERIIINPPPGLLEMNTGENV